MKNEMNPQEMAEIINMPIERWPGQCFAVATYLVERGVVEGVVVSGHYHGYIDPDSVFGFRPFTQHSWVVVGEEIVDPTRWVFDGVEPYIYTGSVDDVDYDVGGNRLRKMYMRPPPPFVESQKRYELPQTLAMFAKTMLIYDGDIICGQQAGWLASLPLDMLGDQAELVYRWIVDVVKTPGFIPYDNRVEILGK